jgi:hypothetical protein
MFGVISTVPLCELMRRIVAKCDLRHRHVRYSRDHKCVYASCGPLRLCVIDKRVVDVAVSLVVRELGGQSRGLGGGWRRRHHLHPGGVYECKHRACCETQRAVIGSPTMLIRHSYQCAGT